MSVQAHTIQGSSAWHEYRRNKGNASEVGSLLDASPWFPKTPFQLWQVKTGRAVVEENAAMRRGSALEHPSRQFIEQRDGDVFEPQVVELDRMSASLDGQTFDGLAILEIKVPMRGRESETWKHVEAHGKPPQNYWLQVQQQLLCSGAERCTFAVFEAEGETITDVITCEVLPSPDAHECIKGAWDEFFSYLDADEPPPMTDADVVERNDIAWTAATAAYREAKEAADAAAKALKDAEARIKKEAGETSTQGAGVKFTRYWQAGSVDYKAALPEGVDMEQYRKAGSWRTRITLEKPEKT